jgi:hypothetical protein
LRWDRHSPWTEKNNRISVFDPASGKIVVPDGALSLVSPLMPRGYVDVIEAKDAGLPSRTLLKAIATTSSRASASRIGRSVEPIRS